MENEIIDRLLNNASIANGRQFVEIAIENLILICEAQQREINNLNAKINNLQK